MGKIVVPFEVRQQLQGRKERQEILDQWGNLLGYFEPSPNAGGWGPFTAEQVERAMRQTGPTRTLDEIYREHGPK